MDTRREILQQMDILRSTSGYLMAGWPRFFWYFSRDAFISAWQMLASDPSIAESTLRFAARHQAQRDDWWSDAECGMIPHQVLQPGDRIYNWKDRLGRIFVGNPYFGSIDATPLFAVLAHRYWRREGARAVPVLLELRPALTSALAWIFSRLRRDRFLVYKKRNPFGFTHQSWRDGYWNHIKIPAPAATVDVQGYAFAALWMGAEIFKKVYGDVKFAGLLLEEARKLRMRFAASFWWEEEKTYYFALAGKSLEPIGRVVPDPAMAIFSGIIPQRLRMNVISRVLRSDMWTPYGIRSLSSEDEMFSPDSYHNGSIWPAVNWLIWKGCTSYGFSGQARLISEAMLAAWKYFGAIPECYGATAGRQMTLLPVRGANMVQAWSLGALYDIVS